MFPIVFSSRHGHAHFDNPVDASRGPERSVGPDYTPSQSRLEYGHREPASVWDSRSSLAIEL